MHSSANIQPWESVLQSSVRKTSTGDLIYEASLARKAAGPGVVPVLGTLHQGAHVYPAIGMVMPFVEGGTLADFRSLWVPSLKDSGELFIAWCNQAALLHPTEEMAFSTEPASDHLNDIVDRKPASFTAFPCQQLFVPTYRAVPIHLLHNVLQNKQRPVRAPGFCLLLWLCVLSVCCLCCGPGALCCSRGSAISFRLTALLISACNRFQGPVGMHTTTRLELMLKIVTAMQHIHQQGVWHRE